MKETSTNSIESHKYFFFTNKIKKYFHSRGLNFLKREHTQKLLFLSMLMFFYNLSFAQFPSPYCTWTVNTVEQIKYVEFAGIANNSSGTAGLEDFTSIKGSVSPGCSYEFKFKATTEGDYDNFLWVFIDWNQNGVFETSEGTFLGFIYSNNGNTLYTALNEVDVPNNALPGNTRMRVTKVYTSQNSSPATQCNNPSIYQYGQAEDYTIAVGPLLESLPNPKVSAASACNNATLNLGAGAYQDLTLSANTYYDFSWTNTPQTSGFTASIISGGAGATSTTFSSNQAGWFSGTTAPTIRVTALSLNCGWSSTSAILSLNHTQPNATTVSGGGAFCSNELPRTLTASGGSNGTIYWQGTTSGGNSTATPSSSQSVSAVGTYYFASNNNGCWGPQGSATISSGGSSTIGSASSSPTLCVNTVMTNITHATTGVTGIGGSVGLPNGVTASYAGNTITISGTPTEIGTFNYTITTVGCGSQTATGTIIVNPSLAATISGTIAACQYGPSQTVTFTGADGVAPYTFTYTLNGVSQTVTSTGDIATVSVPSTTAGTYTFELVSVSDDSPLSCLSVQTGTAIVTINADTENPVITAPSNLTVYPILSCDTTGVALGTPVTSDNCGVASVTNDAPIIFPLGNTTVTWTVEDISGNTSTATQIVSVVDTLSPVVATPSDVTLIANSGCNAVGIGLVSPTASDNCTIVQTAHNAPTSFPAGTTIVTWTIKDNSGNETIVTQNIIVTDQIDPTITAPPAVTVYADAACEATTVNLGTPTAADNCGIHSITDNAPAVFPLGNTTVTWTVEDNSGNTATATQTVTVLDNIKPTITAPPAVTVDANASCEAASVVLGTPTTDDNCGVASVLNDAVLPFPIGSTSVIWTVTDNSGNSETATQIVTVVDNLAPVVTAPSDVTVNVDVACEASGVDLGTPIATDNCGTVTITNDAPTAFPAGTTLVTWTVEDNSNNVTTVTQNVTVIDNVDPTITTPTDVIVNADASCEATITLAAPTTDDNCGVFSVTSNAPTTFPLGTTTVIWTVTDNSGNTATATQIVTVIDDINPTITAPPAITVDANASCEATVSNLGTPTTDDNCGVFSVTSNAPTTFPLGATTVTWTVTDNSGNTATATQIVTVLDNMPPVVTAPSDVIVSANIDCEASGVALGTPIANDNCGSVTITNNAPAAFPLGTTVVTWTVEDNSNNVTTVTQNVTVIDDIDPTITTPADVIVNVDATCEANVSLTTPTTDDNCGVFSVTSNAPTTFPLGTTTVIWTVTDNSGNTATATQIVTVIDDINPTITAPPAITVDANASCEATVSNLGTPTTADNCGVFSVTSNAPTTFPLGATTVTWTVTDNSGNTATATQIVTVLDNLAPIVNAPSDITASANNACSAFNLDLGTPTAIDNCGIASILNDAPVAFPLGTTIVTWTVKDNSGNTTNVTQNVIVVDDTDPVINAPAAVSANVDNACEAIVSLGSPITADNCGILSVLNNAPTSFPVGVTTVTWTVTDNSLNTATATQIVTITDNINPTITANGPVIAYADAMCEANVVLGTPSVADNCGITSVVNDAPISYPSGNTIVTWTATDNSGNTATAMQLVTILDTINPTITAPIDLTISANNACSAFGVNLGTPLVTDNCGVANITNDAPSFFLPGTTIVTWTVTDNSGNTATTTQNVTVVDDVNPTITAPATVMANLNSMCEAIVNLGTPITADNCGVASVTNNAPATFPLGTSTVIWTVTDNSGNFATATQIVNVIDNINPTITAPAAVTSFVDGSCDAVVVLGSPITADNCGVASVVNNAPTTFPIGSTIVTWVVTDNAGNTASATQVVNVIDNIAPVVTAPSDVTANANNACLAFNLNLGTPTATDNCTVASITNDAPPIFSLGVTTVTWTVTDNSGNTTTVTQNVTVNDNVNPSILAPAGITANVNSMCEAIVDLGTPATSDNCGVASVVNDAPTTFPLGTTTVTWTVTDNAGNTATATQTVNVVDNINPTIIVPANIDVTSNSGCDATGVDIGTPITADNCGVASVTNNAPTVFPAGTTVVTWTVIDNAGNQTSGIQLVKVVDNTPPTAVVTDITVQLQVGSNLVIDESMIDNGSFDDCGTITYELSQTTFDCSDIGVNTVTVTITDQSGNKTVTTINVTVEPSGVDLDLDGIDDACDDDINTAAGGAVIPNGFTPDGDGINDLFVIPGLENHTSVDLTIYNRYGNLVYKHDAYANDWNGTSSINGMDLPDGTYYYVLELDKKIIKSGYVYINRAY